MKRHNKAPSSHLPWFGAGILCGLLVSILLFYYQLIPNALLNRKASPAPRGAKSVMAKAKTQTPRFDFYNMLEEKDQATEIPKNYFVQVAALSNLKDAERMKVRLQSNGFNNIQIKSFNKDQTTWYRLILGPYHSKGSALAAQTKLKNSQINGILIGYSG